MSVQFAETQTNDEVPNSNIKESLVASLADVLPVRPEFRERQISVIAQLPDNIVEQMHAHLMDRDEYARRHNMEISNSREDQLMVLRGELFERLACIEQGDSRKITDWKTVNEAVALFHDPKRFGIDGVDRNPDLTLIDVNTKQIVAVVEAKFSWLDWRAYDQMMRYRGSLSKTLGRVRTVKQYLSEEKFAEDVGLSDEVSSLVVAENLERLFVVPANRDVVDPSKLIGSSWDGGSRGLEDFRRQLKDKTIGVERSVFSVDEVVVLTKVIMARISEREKEAKDYAEREKLRSVTDLLDHTTG